MDSTTLRFAARRLRLLTILFTARTALLMASPALRRKNSSARYRADLRG